MVEVFIRLPSRGDGRHLSARSRGDWQPDAHVTLPAFVTDLRGGVHEPFGHLAEIGRAAEVGGFGGVLVPFDARGEESLVVSGSLLRHSRWLTVAAEFHAAAATPVYAAKLSASWQRFSAGRLDWRLAVDLPIDVARAVGDFVEGADRHVRADEFLTVAKGVWQEEGYTFDGRFFHVLAGGFGPPLSGQPFPRVHLSGTSAEAYELSARHADVHVFGVTDDIEAGIAAITAKAAEHGREITFGAELPVLVREDDDEAWAAARRVWNRAGGADARLPDPDPRTRLWPGFSGSATVGAAGLVGSYETVAAGLAELRHRGVGVFVLESHPQLEETYRIGEHLLPLLVKEKQHVD